MTAPRGWLFRVAAAVLAMSGLHGCERGADSGATANPVAPGRPGTGNPTVQLEPRPGSITESPQVGGARAQVPAGVTGSGGPTDVPGKLQGQSIIPRQPGVGIDGGLEDKPVPTRSGSGDASSGSLPAPPQR